MSETIDTTVIGGNVLLVRHGETDWNREGRLQGWAPTPLNERGREQARRVGAELASTYDIDRIVSSDTYRTRETTAMIRNSRVEPEPEFDSAWRERGLGVYQGFTWDELNGRFPAFQYDSGAFALEEQPEGGETLASVYERVVSAWEAICQDPAETTLVVTHGGPITVVLAHIDGLDLTTAIERYDVSNCSVTEIALPEEEIRRETEQLFEPVASRGD